MNIGRLFFVSVAGWLAAFSAPVVAAVDVAAIMQECQKLARSNNQTTVIMWLPTEYWRASLDDFGVPASERDKFTAMVDNYMVLIAVKFDVDLRNGLNFVEQEKLSASITIEDAAGARYQAVDQAKVDAKMRMVLAESRPVLAKAMGPLGDQMVILAFPAVTANGKRIAEPTKEGAFFVNVGDDARFRYRLPLGSLLPPQYDVESGEQFPGNYRFSPFSGKPLQLNPPSEQKTSP